MTTALQGQEGVAAVEEAKGRDDPFALAFIDMNMPPGIDGRETAKRILAIDGEMQIVFVTAYTERTREEIADGIGHRRFFYLKKPFDAEEIHQMAESLALRWELDREREQLDREKEIFIRNMSHELRHPLQVILGVCDTVLNCEMDDERRNQFIRDIETEARRLTKLTENLRATKETAYRSQLHNPNPINLDEIIDQVVRLLSAEAEKKGLGLRRDGSGVERKVLGDANGLVQVLINLVVNAIQYTEQGAVVIEAKREGGRIRVSVRDTGVGIAPSEQQTIFQRFYRVQDQARKVRGHGLGLSIAQEIVLAHGSRIEVDSEPGKGSRFYFGLPVAE